MKKKLALKTLLFATSFVFILGSCSKKSKDDNNSKTSTVITSSDDTTTSNNTTTSGNTNTSNTSGSGNTSTTTTDDVIDYSLDANQFYISNDNNKIIKTFADQNELKTLTFFTKYGQGIYLKPVIENNKFVSVSVINTEKYDDDDNELPLKYIGISSGYTRIFDFAVDNIEDVYVTKPLLLKLTNDNIELKIDDETYNFNIQGKINDNDSLNNIDNKEYKYLSSSLTFTENGYTIETSSSDINVTIKANEFNYVDNLDLKALFFAEEFIDKVVDMDYLNEAYELRLTVNDDYTIESSKLDSNLFQSISRYTYSDDKKTVTKITPNLFPIFDNIFATTQTTTTTSNDSYDDTDVYNYDDNFNLTSYNSTYYMGTSPYNDTTTYEYNDNLSLKEIKIVSEFNDYNRLIKYEYNDKNYLTKFKYGQLNNDQFEVMELDEYTYDDNNKLTNFDVYYNDEKSYSIEEKLEGLKYTKTSIYYNSDGTINNRFSRKTEINYYEDGRINEIINYQYDINVPSMKYIYNYSSSDEYSSIEEVITQNYSNESFVNSYKTVTKEKENYKAYEEYDFNADYNKFVLKKENIDYVENGMEIFIKNIYKDINGNSRITEFTEIKESDTFYSSAYIYFDDDGYATEGKKVEDISNTSRKEYKYFDDREDFVIIDEKEYFENTKSIVKKHGEYEYDQYGTLEYSCVTNYQLSKDGNDHLEKDYLEYVYNQDGSIYFEERCTYTIDDEDRTIKTEYISYNEGEFDEKYIEVYEYDGDTCILQSRTYYDENDNMTAFYTEKLINNNFERIVEKVLVNDELKTKLQITFNDDNTMNKKENYYYSSDEYYLYRYIVENYDHGTPTTKEDHYYNNEGTETSKETYEYINGDYRIKGRYTNKSTNLFKGLLITVNYDYDENGNNIKYQMYSYYDDSIQVNYYEKVDGYSSLQKQSYETTYYNSEAVATSSEVFVKVGDNSFACTEKYTIIDGIKYLIDKKIYQENSSYYLAWFECDFDAENKFYNYILEKDYDENRNTINVYRYQNKKESNTHQIYQLKSNYIAYDSYWKCDDAYIGNYYNTIELAAEVLTFEDVVEIYNNRNNQE